MKRTLNTAINRSKNTMCSNVLAAVATSCDPPVELTWLEGVNSNAYYFVYVVAERGPAPIRFTGDQASRLGNPVVQARGLAEGRDDLAFGVLATENLDDWSGATLVPMKRFETDGFWKPVESENNPSYVFPAKMFFRYTIDVR